MPEQLYPKNRKPKNKSWKPWHIHYDLSYDGGGSRWTGYYRTRTWAKVCAFVETHIRSWGGSAELRHKDEVRDTFFDGDDTPFTDLERK